MALVVKDRVKETTTTTGTGTITLAGAADGYQSFSVIGNGNTTYYAIVGDNEWEVGVGTYTASGTTLSRDTVLESSNSGNAVNFSSGEKQVFCTYPAEKMITVDNDGSGSGLDADLLDGQQGSYYQPASSALTTSTTFGGDVSGTYNAIVVANDSHTHDGRYYTETESDNRYIRSINNAYCLRVYDNRNNDTSTDLGSAGVQFEFKLNTTDSLDDGGSYHGVMTFQQWGDSSGGDTNQLAFTDNQNMWLRGAGIGGSWGSWNKIWHSGNDGSGSGLDADLLDGQQGSYYLNWNNITNPPSIPSEPNDATITISAGTGLSGGGNFTTDQASNETITLSHADTSTLSGVYGSTANGTKIDTITVDENGHITAIATGATGDIDGVTAGSGLTGGGTSGTVTLSHADTSSQASVDNSNGTVIQDVSVDGFGHVTSLGSVNLDNRYGATLATYGTTSSSSGRIRCTAPFNTNSAHMFQITVSVYSSYTVHNYVVGGYMYPSTNQWYSPTCVYSGTGTPDIIVGRDSSGKAYISIANGNYTGVRVHNMTLGYQTSFADIYDPWTITIDAGTENSVTPAIYKTWTSGNDGSGSGLDADTVDGIQASSFLRSDEADTKTAGNLIFADNVRANFGASSDLNIYHNGSSSYIDNNTNHLYIRNNVDGDDGGDIYIQAKSGEHGIIVYDDSYVSLYDNGTERLRVDSPIYAYADIRLQGSGYDLIYDKGTYITTLSSINPASQNQTIYLPDATGYASVKSFSQGHELNGVSGITLTPANNWRKIEIVLTVDEKVLSSNSTTPRVGIDMTANGQNVFWRYYKDELHEVDYYNQVWSANADYIWSYYFTKESILILNLWRTDDTNDCRVMFDLQIKEGTDLANTDAAKFYKISGSTSAAISKLSHQIQIGLGGGTNWNGVEYFTTVEYHN